ncbi:glycosyltransferase family protein [Albimonas pacifica]|uniref:Glycosyltransferase involved in cell wall bisynthesis n=1 Tax=Albimonas pacifica TaxID=1114924 RepID=A0A1I3FN25_9RHOB|nr:glycosyltransferase [Albimonas pacifica]SFI12341.1 Glycosyltransferase involved in cell wall bisynthesis [Albimonas pacifica]
MTSHVYTLLVGPERRETLSRPEPLAFLDDGDTKFHRITLKAGGGFGRLRQVLGLLPRLRRAKLVVTTEYIVAWSVGLLFFLTRAPAKHVVVGLNISGRPIQPRRRWMRWLANLAFRRVDLAIVASRPEARIFHRMHDIPMQRFAFALWSFDLPSDEGSAFRRPDRPYFCLIGRNNRDHETFCKALEGLDAEGVIVSSAPPAIPLPANVRALTNIPFADCIDCIKGSVANVILVNDANRGAGHITIVTAMHCARPQIISDVDTATDYFIEDEHVLTVPLADAEATRAAMAGLLADPARADRMGAASAAYALRWLTHEKREQRLAEIQRDWWTGGGFAPIDPDWAAERGVSAQL